MMLAEKIGKFNARASEHLEKQSLNPFSGRFSSRSPSPRPGSEDYGRPLAGSKTEERGQKAKSHINKEILELCNCIYDVGMHNAELRKKDPDYDPSEDDGTVLVTFGELFQIYTKINDKVVGLLIAAKKRGFVYFEKEILFQRRDDDVLIALIKPIEEIREIMRQALTASPMPVPSPEEGSSRMTTPSPKPKIEPELKEEEAPVVPHEEVDIETKSNQASPGETKDVVVVVIEANDVEEENTTAIGGIEANQDTNECKTEIAEVEHKETIEEPKEAQVEGSKSTDEAVNEAKDIPIPIENPAECVAAPVEANEIVIHNEIKTQETATPTSTETEELKQVSPVPLPTDNSEMIDENEADEEVQEIMKGAVFGETTTQTQESNPPEKEENSHESDSSS